MPNTWTAATCGRDDINDYAGDGAFAGSVADDDTVIVPSGTCTHSGSVITITKGITLQSASGCTVDGSGYPTGCATTIRDGAAGQLISWTVPANKTGRLSGFAFNDNGGTGIGAAAKLQFNGAASGAQIRNDHLYFDHFNNSFSIHHFFARGVVDHCTFLFVDSGTTPMYPYEGNNASTFGDPSWSDAVTWGSSDFLFIEDNKFVADTVNAPCHDGFVGFRVVFRFNSLTNCSPQWHGTESGGRGRSARAEEVYGNVNHGTVDEIVGIRGGSCLAWQNTGVATVQAAAKLVYDRATYTFYYFGGADGTNPFDLNDAGNPFDSKTAASGGTLTVTVAGTPWTGIDYMGYTIKKTSACTGQCHAVIQSNTNNTITYSSNGSFGADMTFSAGETFNINKVTRALDQPGVGGGTITLVNCTFTSSGTSATAVCNTHGWSESNTVAFADYGSGSSGYNGYYSVHVVDTNTVTYTCSTTCGGSTSGAGVKIPNPNDQTYFPIYQWLNDDGTSNVLTAAQPTSIGICTENQSFYNYGGTLQSNATTPFNGTAAVNNGVGVGTKARMPTSCTGSSWYWATDEGSWRTAVPSTGQTFQGLGYQCNGSTFALAYTPYYYPHPLIGAVAETQHPAVMIPMRMIL